MDATFPFLRALLCSDAGYLTGLVALVLSTCRHVPGLSCVGGRNNLSLVMAVRHLFPPTPSMSTCLVIREPFVAHDSYPCLHARISSLPVYGTDCTPCLYLAAYRL